MQIKREGWFALHCICRAKGHARSAIFWCTAYGPPLQVPCRAVSYSCPTAIEPWNSLHVHNCIMQRHAGAPVAAAVRHARMGRQGDFPARRMIDSVTGVDPARRARLVQVLDIDPDWRMHRVSDGQRRRVQICLGLLHPFEARPQAALDAFGARSGLRHAPATRLFCPPKINEVRSCGCCRAASASSLLWNAGAR